MKKSNLKINLSLLFTLSVSILACEDEDNGMPVETKESLPSIAEQITLDPALDSLELALSRTGLLSMLQNDKSYTLFAQNNINFSNSSPIANYPSIDSIPIDILTDVLKNNIIGEEVRLTDFTDHSYGTTLNRTAPNGEANLFEVDITGGLIINGNIFQDHNKGASLEANNGIIHFVDKIITSRGVDNFIIDDERFSSFNSALVTSSFDLQTSLAMEGPFTIFIPTNSAFTDLLNSDSTWNSFEDIDSLRLDSILSYHILKGSNLQSNEFSQGQTIPTLNLGNNLTVNLTNGFELVPSDTNQSAAKIIGTNIQGNNGVIHIVDKVLLP